MGIISRAADTYYAYRFIKHLVTPWNKMKAYELGLVDENGKKLKSPQTSEERSEYSYFHRLVFNLKRILEKLPFGKSRLASYAAALFLIKEDGKLSDEQLSQVLKQMDIDSDSFLLVLRPSLSATPFGLVLLACGFSLSIAAKSTM